MRMMARFFVRIPNPCITLCCSLASHDAAPEHTGTGKEEVLRILCWTDSVCEVLSLQVLELCVCNFSVISHFLYF